MKTNNNRDRDARQDLIILVGHRIRKYRVLRGLTQQEVAQFLGHVSHRQVSRWELGDSLPTVRSLILLSSILNRQIIDLVYPLYNYYRKVVRERLEGKHHHEI